MERNDFEKWITGVFGDEKLAQIINRKAIFQCENRRNELVTAIQDYLEALKKRQQGSVTSIS